MEIQTPPRKQKIDIDKLSYAVAMAETKDCTIGNSAKVLNCFGIMEFGSFGRRYKKYNSKEESYADFKRIRENYYGGFPDYRKAKRYTGGDRVETWLINVKFYYYN